MTDVIRAHERLAAEEVPGRSIRLEGVLARPVDVYAAHLSGDANEVDLLIHFHGSSHVPKYAVYHAKQPLVLAVVNLGSGSSVYESAFQQRSTFPGLIASVAESVARTAEGESKPRRIFLSSFSAGYGAVRAILRDHSSAIQGIILLDGLHTDYLPPGQVLAQGGALNERKLQDFVAFAKLAMTGTRQLLITHSEVFPGTYASTTETTDFLLAALQLKRHPVLRWGPGGMQLLTETRARGLTVLGFAGNSAPDHIDHFHGLPTFLTMVLDQRGEW